MSRFIRYTTHTIRPAVIDPGSIRAFLPSPHGENFTLLVIDGGTKVHVNNGDPDKAFRDANPGTDEPLPGFVRRETAEQSASPNEYLTGQFGAGSPTSQYVADFSCSMEDRLSRNRHKGNREGWLKETVTTHIDRAKQHLKDLETAFLHGAKQEEIDRLTADCANRLMMLRDRFATIVDT